MAEPKAPSSVSRRSLEGANFFLSDVRDGMGPFMAIFLATQLDWKPGDIGLALSVVSIATLIAQTPIGAFIDQTTRKRTLIVVASLAVSISCLAMVLFPSFWMIMAGQAMIGVAGAVFQPAIGAITLGLVGRHLFSRQIGRNEAFNHGGNVFFAAVSMLIGWWFDAGAIFYLIAVLGLVAGFSIMGVRGNEIDHDRAREMPRDADPNERKPSGFLVLLESRTLLIFTLCITLFHFANAAMLPLVSEYASESLPKNQATTAAAVCVLFAQLIMIPMAILVGRKVDAWGRKPIFLVGFGILPLRGILYTLWDNPYYLMTVQLLDGVGAGIFGALFFIVLADIMRGTGRYNIAQGAVLTVMGIGISLSNLVAGQIAEHFGYNAAFLTLAAIAATAFLVYYFFMPETRHQDVAASSGPADGSGEGEPAEENEEGK